MAGSVYRSLIWLFLPAAVSGCATGMHLACGPLQVYGGTRSDGKIIAHTAEALVKGRNVQVKGATFESVGTTLVLTAALVDLPLSFVADTVTLPWTVAWWAIDRQLTLDYQETDEQIKAREEYRRTWLEGNQTRQMDSNSVGELKR